jgi:hypothetical protein
MDFGGMRAFVIGSPSPTRKFLSTGVIGLRQGFAVTGA